MQVPRHLLAGIPDGRQLAPAAAAGVPLALDGGGRQDVQVAAQRGVSAQRARYQLGAAVHAAQGSHHA